MSTAVQFIQPSQGVIKPRWWTGTPAIDPDCFTVDASAYAMNQADLQPGSELGVRMNRLFDELGLVYLTNTGLADPTDMRAFAKLVVDKEMRYLGGANPRGNIAPNVYEVGAPLPAWLHYHHEMAYIGSSTRLVSFLCKHALPDRGWTFVSDNVRATDAIMQTELGHKLKELGLCYHRNLTDREHFRGTEELGVYNHWQQSMLTEDPDEAERVARERGLETEWGPNRLLKTRYYISAFEYFPQLDRNLLFSSIADDSLWFDGWPKVMHLPHEERPLKLTFGDGSELSWAEKQLFVDVYDDHGIPLKWQQGDIAIICNYRFAHGRPGIELADGESRELGVLIGQTFDRIGDLADKW